MPVLSAHVRQPINDIFASLLSLGRRVEDTELPQLESIQNNCYTLLRLSHNMETLDKMAAGKFASHTIDLSALVEALCEDTRNACRQTGIPIQTQLAEDALFICADKNLLCEAILNILRNCMQYTRDGNHINVKLYAAGGRAILSIEDKGLGIKPQFLNKIFEPYFSQDPYGDGAERPGTGLGLAVALQVAKGFGGTLLAESTFGQGSRFTFSLPLAPPNQQALGSAPADYLMGRYSPVFVQMSDYCRYPDL